MSILACPSTRVTGSMTSFLMEGLLPEFHFRCQLRHAALDQFSQRIGDRSGRRRTARDVEVHLDDFVDRYRLSQERGDSIHGDAAAGLYAFHIDAFQHLRSEE